MSFQLEDGQGRGYKAIVREDQKLFVHATSESVFQSTSDELRQSYSWSSTYAATANDEVIYIKNTSGTKHLHIVKIICKNTVNCDWDIFIVNSGTAAGTTITGVNINSGSGNTAAATSYGNAAVTGGLSGLTVGYDSSLANVSTTLDFEGALILDSNGEIAVTASATGTVRVSVYGFYEGVD